MEKGTFNSASELIADFILNLKEDNTLDAATVEVLEKLNQEDKLTNTRIAQELESRRKAGK
jgi:Arc/MetJ-type ribon-helix-helix transcriptional regulator